MDAMVLTAPGTPLQWQSRDTPQPGDGEVLVTVSACGVCRTDLHVVDGELPNIRYPIIPGHEIVGRVAAVGAGVTSHQIGDRVGIPWLGHTCGVCRYCRSGMENLCDVPLFTATPATAALRLTPSPTRATRFRSARPAMMLRLRRCYAPD